MPYNTPKTAKDILGDDVSEELLKVARSMIDNYSPFRWEETAKTETLSGDGESRTFFINFPVTQITSFTIDSGDGNGAVNQAEGADFDVRKDIGMVTVYKGLPAGENNIVISYKYGYDSNHEAYNLVRMVEAQIALYLQKNPAMLREISFGDGDVKVNFGSGIPFYLSLIPKPLEV